MFLTPASRSVVIWGPTIRWLYDQTHRQKHRAAPPLLFDTISSSSQLAQITAMDKSGGKYPKGNGLVLELVLENQGSSW